MRITFESIDLGVCEANGWDILNIYRGNTLIDRVPLSETDPSGRLEVVLEREHSGAISASYSTLNPLAKPRLLIDDDKIVGEIKPETLSGSLDELRSKLSHED